MQFVAVNPKSDSIAVDIFYYVELIKSIIGWAAESKYVAFLNTLNSVYI